MGWLIYHTAPRSVAQEIRGLCTFGTETRNACPVALARVDEPFQDGPVWYAAVRCELSTPQAIRDHIEQGDFALQGDHVYTFGAIFLTRSDGSGWGYKDMDETVGPTADFAPACVLDALSPTSAKYALGWRARCRANLARYGEQFVRFQRSIAQDIAAAG